MPTLHFNNFALFIVFFVIDSLTFFECKFTSIHAFNDVILFKMMDYHSVPDTSRILEPTILRHPTFLHLTPASCWNLKAIAVFSTPALPCLV